MECVPHLVPLNIQYNHNKYAIIYPIYQQTNKHLQISLSRWI